MVVPYKNDVTGVIYLETHQMSLYSEQLEEISSLAFLEGMVGDMMVLDPDQLMGHIASWYSHLEIEVPLKQLIIVLGPSVYFQKYFPFAENGQSSSEVQTFVESVPFELSLHSVYKEAEGDTVISANEDFVDAVSHVLKQHDVANVFVFPSYLFAESGEPFSFDDNEAEFVLRKYTEFHKKALRVIEFKENESKGDQTFAITTEKPKLTDTRFVLLIVVFGILIAVLIFLVVQNLSLTSGS